MLKTFALCALSSLAASAATIDAISSTKTIDDRCRIYGYTRCTTVGDVSGPSTSDPKLRAELTRFVRQVSRDKL